MIKTIENAIKSLGASLPDASWMMVHGSECGQVIACSSAELSGDTVSADAPTEQRRVIGARSDFATVVKGSTVSFGEETRIVTSAKTDPVGASLTLGLSAPLNKLVASYQRVGTAIRQPIQVLAVESDVVDVYSNNIAPTTCRAWFVCISAEHWLETSEPQIGDEITFDEIRLRVAAVKKLDGMFILTSRARR